jgi:hypothetical protein
MQVISQFDWAQMLSFLIGTVLPLLVGLVTNWSTRPAVRAVLLLFLSAVTSVLTELLASITNDTPFAVWPVVFAALGTFLVGVGMHFGLWKPSGAADKAIAVGSSPPA